MYAVIEVKDVLSKFKKIEDAYNYAEKRVKTLRRIGYIGLSQEVKVGRVDEN